MNEQAAGDLQRSPQSSLQVLFRNDAKRHEVRRMVSEAFGTYFVIDPTNLGQIRIRLADRPPREDMEERGIHADAVQFHAAAQLIDQASDGVKAFTGIVTEVMAGDPSVILIDEPEAFLHPSLASKLGYEVSRAALSADKRVFVSTHSPSFVMGCIQSGAPVNIVRLTYRGCVATARVLPSAEILELMRHPLLRSTGVLSGLFYEFVVVTESDADRAFYQEVNERLGVATIPTTSTGEVMKYKGLETSHSLLFSYEVLSLQYKRKNEPRAAFSEEHKTGALAAVPSMNFNNYGYTFALLNINAAIVEGVMRSILSELVSEEVDRQVTAGKQAGRTARSSPENLLNKFFIEIDAQGGWEKLKEQYASYLGVAIDKSIQPQTKEAMSTLFLLRNILAHGTALIHPSEQLADDLKDEPIFKWQSRLQSARVYLHKQFGHEDIFENLAEFGVPEHFLQKTKDFLTEILSVISHQPQRASKTIADIQRMSFGYINITN